MFSTSLSQLEVGLTELKNYIAYNSLVNETVAEANQKDSFNNEKVAELLAHTNQFQRKKIFEYNSYIISLYGLLERYLEDVLEHYLIYYSSFYQTFTDIPEFLRNKSINLSVELLGKLDRPKYKHITTAALINTINEALTENQPYLIPAAFSHHNGNFRHSVIVEYFKQIGIDNISSLLNQYDPLKSALEAQFGNTANTHNDTLYSVINDLAQRRNDVAHGVSNIELIGPSIIIDYIDFVRHYCSSLYNVLQNELCKMKFCRSTTVLRIVQIINREILCIYPCNIELKIGDNIVMKKPDGNYPQFEELSIEELQISNISQSIIYATNTENIGIKSSKRIKENYEFRK